MQSLIVLHLLFRHIPPKQVVPLRQKLPHAPQFKSLVWRSTDWPPQQVFAPTLVPFGLPWQGPTGNIGVAVIVLVCARAFGEAIVMMTGSATAAITIRHSAARRDTRSSAAGAGDS